MGLLRKLFGRKTTALAASTLAASTPVAGTAAPAIESATQSPADPAQDPNMIRVFDAYGREMFITKQQWRDNVLLGHLKKVWNQPNDLYATIVQSLQDGFGADMAAPAEQLAKIDPDKERGAVVLAIVYREQKRLTDSERVLRRHIEAHGESGIILTNLAKVQADRGQADLSLQTLWHGLELDPNQENGLDWYTAIFREKDGDAGYVAALRHIADLPQSWRARVWLAREAQLQKDLESALKLYDEAIALAPRPAPTDLLQQISGDLGNQGHLPEILRLIEPLFQIEVHGLAVGNNLIKANLDLGRLDAVQSLLARHYAQQRADWKETLAFWDTELAKARVATVTPQPDQKFSVAMLVGTGPLWLPADSPAAELFPLAPGPRIRVAFLGSTAELAAPGDKPHHQMSDNPGRLSRAIPQFLSQEVFFRGRADVHPIVPWLTGDEPAFVLGGVAWNDDEAARYARTDIEPSDYVVVTHLRTVENPWTVELRLIRTIDAKCLGSASAPISFAQPEAGLRQAARDLLALLREHADYESAPPPPLYRPPADAEFAYYLLRLEQLLAVRCSTQVKVPASFLSGTREILDGNLQLCLHHPDNVVTRLVLVQTLQRMKQVLPEVVQEYRDKVRLLQKEEPLPGSAQAIVERLLTEVYP